VVRHLSGSTSAGIHQITWDYRYAGRTPLGLRGDGYGPLALPGQYTITVAARQDGQLQQLAGPASFEVKPLGVEYLSQSQLQRNQAFQQKTAELQRAVMGAYRVAQDTAEQLEYLKRAAELTPGVDPQLRKQVRQTELRLQDMIEKFQGDPTRPRRNEPAMPGILSRVRTVVYGTWSTTQAATGTHQRSYEIAADEFSEVLAPLRKLVERDVPALGRKLEAAGAPWTPGRRIPDWKK
jgi:hypothetical protein